MSGIGVHIQVTLCLCGPLECWMSKSNITIGHKAEFATQTHAPTAIGVGGTLSVYWAKGDMHTYGATSEYAIRYDADTINPQPSTTKVEFSLPKSFIRQGLVTF